MNIDLNISCANDGGEASSSVRVDMGESSKNQHGGPSEQYEENTDEFISYHDESDSGAESEDPVDGEDGEDFSHSHKFDSVEDCDTAAGACSVQVSRNLVESMLNVGCYVDTLDEVHVLYREYGRLSGFSVRKGNQSYFLNSSSVRAKIYHCSCEGYPDNKCSIGKVPVCKKQSYRCNCKAKLRVARDDFDSRWKVTIFYNEHNHKLLDPSESYLLRSARNMSQSKKTLLLALTSNGIGVSRAYGFMENEAGGRAHIGFLRKDVYNELDRDRRKMYKVANSDVNKLIEYFTDKGLGDPSFYWKVKVGDDGRLNNLFFRDTRCLIDYQHFGDVVSIDATYKTNKYDLVCVPIIGINHHRTNVLFAMAFLSNEKTESYEWLFSTFLESMYHREPTVIFSDQDQALMNGVDNTFREACHRLCQWHINKNAGKQFGTLNHNKHFKSMWYRCMNGCENEEEFEASWKSMTEEFNLLENRWFKNMYSLRKRWSSAFTLDKFCGGLHATSRSEGCDDKSGNKAGYVFMSYVGDGRIPDEMVLNRWRRDSKERIPLKERVIGCAGPNKFSNMVFVNHNAKRVYDLLSDCKDNETCRDAVNDYIGTMIGVVRSMMKGSKTETKETLHRPIRNPIVKRKRNSRRKMCSSMWEQGGRANNHSSYDDDDDSHRSNFGFINSGMEHGITSPDRFSMD
ncbi:protein FAR1-RELATED SEQUENCE 5-like [Salvia miltiorrhiza]|uniref:protein FAR1-RELATED SEQUENCE 5-like n=1 Tax=Salvia miltiorrhiza TaxID=226208 RepID=UPI0025AC9253|nr:protein FAR1-RELATED SEQUENCE 5-like [Salvia miltiorrhiza]